MRSSDKLGLLKKAFTYLTENIGNDDVISIVTYAGGERVVLEGCSGAKKAKILTAVNSLEANGSTNGEAGLKKAYQIAEKYYIEGGNNRIIMASDGDLNVGISSVDGIKKLVEEKRDAGVFMSVLGFGTGNYKDDKMETIADCGNGVYYYIDSEIEAEKIFGAELFSTLYTVAKDVKLQLTFNPEYITAYRLVGYENRMLANEDFENDTKDAGEVGAGHQVTVCYELCLTEAAMTEGANWLELAVNYKLPDETVSVFPNLYNIGYADYCTAVNADMAAAGLSFRNDGLGDAVLTHDEGGINSIGLSPQLRALFTCQHNLPPLICHRIPAGRCRDGKPGSCPRGSFPQ
jgi:hypothetical protein